MNIEGVFNSMNTPQQNGNGNELGNGNCNPIKNQKCNIDGRDVVVNVEKYIEDTAEEIIETIISYICSQLNNIKRLNCNEDFENNFIMKIIIIILNEMNINKNKKIIENIVNGKEEYEAESEEPEPVSVEGNHDKIVDEEKTGEENKVEDTGLTGAGTEGLPKILKNGIDRQECLVRVSSCITMSTDVIKNKIKDTVLNKIKNNKNKDGIPYFHRIIEGIKYSIKLIKRKDIEHNCYNFILKKYYFDLLEDYTKNKDTSIVNDISKKTEWEQDGGTGTGTEIDLFKLGKKVFEGNKGLTQVKGEQQLKGQLQHFQGQLQKQVQGQKLEQPELKKKESEGKKQESEGEEKELEGEKIEEPELKGEQLEELKNLGKDAVNVLEKIKTEGLTPESIEKLKGLTKKGLEKLKEKGPELFEEIIEKIKQQKPEIIEKLKEQGITPDFLEKYKDENVSNLKDDNKDDSENINEIFFEEIFKSFCDYLKDNHKIIEIIDEIISFLLNMLPEGSKTNDENIVLDSFKTNLLKKNISEILNELFKKKLEYEKMKYSGEEQKEQEKKEKEQEQEKREKNSIVKTMNKPIDYFKKKITGLKGKINIDTVKLLFNNVSSLASTSILQHKLNNIIKSVMNSISKEILSEIIPKKYEENELTKMYINKIKDEITKKTEINIEKPEIKNNNFKKIFYPLIKEYRNQKNKDEEIKKKNESKFLKRNWDYYTSSKNNINNISIINYIIKLCEKIEINKTLLELNNIYLIKYDQKIPKGNCKGKTLMFFDETIKGESLEQQSLMMYNGDLKFLLLCDEYDPRKYKSKMKKFKKYEEFKILSMIKKNFNYKIKLLDYENIDNSFFNKFYSLEEEYSTSQTGGKFIDNIKSSAASLLELGSYQLKKVYKNDIRKNFSDKINKREENKNSENTINNHFNIIGDIIEIEFPNNSKYDGVFYGIIFKKIKEEKEKKEDVYEILFKSDREKKSLAINFEGKVENDYLHSFQIFLNKSDYNKMDIYNDENKEEILSKFVINPDENNNYEDQDVKIKKVFTFYNYYKSFNDVTLTFQKIISNIGDDIPFLKDYNIVELKKNLGVLFDVVFFNKELRPEKSYSRLRTKDSKGSKCSIGFNKKIKCLFLFIDKDGKKYYLKAQHYAGDLKPIVSEKTLEQEPITGPLTEPITGPLTNSLQSEKTPLTSVIEIAKELTGSEKTPLTSVIKIAKELTGSEKTPLTSVVEIAKEITGSKKIPITSTPSPNPSSGVIKEYQQEFLNNSRNNFKDFLEREEKEKSKKPITTAFKNAKSFIGDLLNKEYREDIMKRYNEKQEQNKTRKIPNSNGNNKTRKN
jgi:hypothetical protein